ncbi:MAG: dTDP-4-amino-4,6-dideoxygalactose transaminase [Marivirga sp.]|jgi:dTDP-4-amino-4,6-dideoxygalactose transaminase
MKPTQIPFLKFDDTDEIVETAVKEVISSGVYFNGLFTQNFKEKFTEYVGRKYMVPTANCTDALEIVLRSLDLLPDDEVIVPAFGWYSDASMVRLVGAKLLFLDIDLKTFSVSLKGLEAVYNKKVKALVLPHLYGLISPEISGIQDFCKQHAIYLIEDCAQAHGSTAIDGRAGTFGDAAVFSFYPTKNLGGIGDAGCILSDNAADVHLFTMLAKHGQTTRNTHEILGINSRMDEIQAAILTKRLPLLNYTNRQRRELAEIYFQKLRHFPIVLPLNNAGHVFHQFVVLSKQRDELRNFLLEKGVETAVHYPTALYMMQPFSSAVDLSCPNALNAAQEVLSLPIYPNHSVEEILFVCEQIALFFSDLNASEAPAAVL